MRILADANIPAIADACEGLGIVQLYDSADEAAVRDAIRDADVLLCRSTLRVDAAMLSGTRVRFVATATSGTDHVDTRALAAAGITFASAAGSNALSVAEYVFAALYRLGSKRGFDPATRSIGIIGAGHVGTWVAHIAERLGMRIVLNDPPLEERQGGAAYRPLDEALACDIVTLHVPLTEDGPHPTLRLMDARNFAAMRDDAVFINTARGGVIDPAVFLARAGDGAFLGTVLDVFPSEPAVDPALVDAVDIATPHIAGHSTDGKLLGTQMVYEALCLFAGTPPAWNYLDLLPPLPSRAVPAHENATPASAVHAAIAAAYDIAADDDALRHIVTLDPGERGRAFQRYRNAYRERREFIAHRFEYRGVDATVEHTLVALGFPMRDEEQDSHGQ